MDCFADAEVLGKVGKDICEGKCSWLINTALLHPSLTNEDRTILLANYGQEDAECEARVKALFHRLDLEGAYLALEKKTKAKLEADLDALNLSCPESFLIKDSIRAIMAKIFGRQK